MNKNVLIVLAGGFVVAILVAVLVQASLGGKKTADTGPKTQVLVATKDLMLGKEIQPGDLKWQTWPGEKAFAGAIVRKEEMKADDALKGRLVQRVSAGQPVLKSYVFKEGKGNVVAATLGKGMRAVAIPVKANTMAGGFISPGDYVDVVLSYQVRTGSSEDPTVLAYVQKYASETILQNIKVLAVDQESSREEDKAKIARTVTLEVNTNGAERLAMAADMGDLTLALRGLGDAAIDDKNSMTTDVQVSRVMQDLAKLRGGANGPGGTVRIYNGNTLQTIRTRSAAPGDLAPAVTHDEEPAAETVDETVVEDTTPAITGDEE